MLHFLFAAYAAYALIEPTINLKLSFALNIHTNCAYQIIIGLFQPTGVISRVSFGLGCHFEVEHIIRIFHNPAEG